MGSNLITQEYILQVSTSKLYWIWHCTKWNMTDISKNQVWWAWQKQLLSGTTCITNPININRLNIQKWECSSTFLSAACLVKVDFSFIQVASEPHYRPPNYGPCFHPECFSSTQQPNARQYIPMNHETSECVLCVTLSIFNLHFADARREAVLMSYEILNLHLFNNFGQLVLTESENSYYKWFQKHLVRLDNPAKVLVAHQLRLPVSCNPAF